MTTSSIIQGYALAAQATTSYRGIDREPFAPLVLPDDVALDNELWRQTAYDLFEFNSVELYRDGGIISLISSLGAAEKIAQLMTPLRVHQILYVEVMTIEDAGTAMVTDRSIGLDLAYLGGDYYSAIRNGLFVNPSRLLQEEFGPMLNEFGLFTRPEVLPGYDRRFRELVKSESSSKFWCYALSLPK